MEDTQLTVASLGEGVLNTLSEMLDNATCGWQQLAGAMSEHPHFRCSETEMTSYSLQVLSTAGSPARALLARLADRGCSLDLLLQCLRKLDHQEAVQCLTSSVAERIQITVQPQSQQASLGGRVVLTCRASGPPGLIYQWFRRKVEVSGETACTPELVLCPLSPTHQGHYICRVNHGDKCVFSQWAHVRSVSSAGASAGCSGTLFPGLASGLRIIHQPQATVLSEGDTLLLQCKAEANPPAQYEWYHNEVPLSEHKTGSLRVACVTTAHRGAYRCKVFNNCQEMWSDVATVTIGPSSITEAAWVEADRGLDSPETHKSAGGRRVNLLNPMSSQPPSKQFYATDKIALLIGNMNYHNLIQLAAPIADVHELTNLLRQMDFKVVSLLDLHWQEMHSAVTEFLLLLDKGVYGPLYGGCHVFTVGQSGCTKHLLGFNDNEVNHRFSCMFKGKGLLYFAGHGYENYGNSFMIPIDAPASFTSEHCLCVQNILTRMQEKRTGLNVFLLDMCRKRNPHDDIIVQPGLLKVTANIVFGYATCADAEAYELQREDVSNGIFINFLKRRVCEDEKVTVMLDRVAEDMGRCVLTRGRQALELRSNLSERRSLTDQIQAAQCSASYSARNLQWAVAHVLPQSKYLQFDCGVTVQLGFAAEFSNVMVIYTRILDKPKEIVSCSAQLTDFPADVDVDLKRSNQETLLEAGSLFLIKDELLSTEVPSLYTRILNLQRLRRELTFSVCLHYTYFSMDEEVQERQLVTVGKPLVSKLNLHEPRAPCTSPTSSSFSLDSLNISKYSSLTQGASSSGSSSNTWECYGTEHSMTDSPTTSRSANVPEETEGPELPYDGSNPLDAGKSLPHSQVNETNYTFSDMFSFHSQ